MGRLRLLIFVVFFWFFILGFSCSLNREGLALLKFKDKVVVDPFGALSNWVVDDGSTDPCSWSGIGCWNGKVVTLDLRDLCLMGTLAPEIGDLGYLKFIILRNNSFFGSIPEEIKELKELEVLDIGYNNFSGLFPAEFGNDISLTTLLLDNNQFLGSIAPELEELKLLSEFQVDKNLLDDAAVRPSCNVDGAFVWNAVQHGNTADRRRLQEVPDYKSPFQAHTRDRQRFPSPSPPPSSFPMTHISAPLPAVSPGSPVSSPTASFSAAPSPLYSPFSSPSASATSSISSPATSRSTRPIPVLPAPVLQAEPAKSARAPQSFSASYPNQTAHKGSSSKHHTVLLLIGTIGGVLLLLVPVICMVFFRSTKVVTVRPWTTGLSGQLQKAFVTGVPNLQRSELEAACEDFSNIIGSFSDGTIYKGTLSSGVEIAVTSFVATSSKAWSKDLETRFRNKIEELSKVNHKNFVNLIGYCEEDEPFTRMMVFEYAPNGTLFEHLHVKEAEHLDWATRIRIAVGMAYCLEHMHQLVPAIALRNLQSSSVFLTEDYAAKIADFCFWSSASNDKMGSTAKEHIDNLSPSLESNAYSFGLILLEMMTGRIPYSKSNIADWAMDRLSRRQPVKEIVDPTLKTFNENEFEMLFEVIKSCVHPDPRERLTMREITRKLKEITAMGPDGATPKHSPLWWAELEIMSEAE